MASSVSQVRDSGELAIQIELSLESKAQENDFAQAKKVLEEHPGSSPIWLQVGADNGERAPRLRSRSLKATPDRETVDALRKLFGPGNVRLVRAWQPEIDTSASDRRAMWAAKKANGG